MDLAIPVAAMEKFQEFFVCDSSTGLTGSDSFNIMNCNCLLGN